jgi:hypothetical protein
MGDVPGENRNALDKPQKALSTFVLKTFRLHKNTQSLPENHRFQRDWV